MSRRFLLSGAARKHPDVAAWFADEPAELAAIAQRWFEVIRSCGDDVWELLHDGHPTACVGGAAFAYVDAFSAHVNVGFFQGAEFPDPAGLLQGAGKHMRHVKLRPGRDIDAKALTKLIQAAYAEVKRTGGVRSSATRI